MDAPAAPVTISSKYRLWLPYWAVFQTDLKQTLRNWVYRLWVIGVGMAAFGYILYRMGVHREAGLMQDASIVMSDLLRWLVLGSVAIIAALTVGSIAAERGTLADSVLSRGISRHQYYLAKWHSRLASVLGTFGVLMLGMLTVSYFALHENLTIAGCATALAIMIAFLTLVVSCGVALSALCNSTLLGMSLLWTFLYGGGFLLELLPKSLPSPDRVLHQLPEILQGTYDGAMMLRLLGAMFAVSGIAAVIGLVTFARRDV